VIFAWSLYQQLDLWWVGPAIFIWCIYWTLNWKKHVNKDNATTAATWLAKRWLGRK
jgi:hypothetical protein